MKIHAQKKSIKFIKKENVLQYFTPGLSTNGTITSNSIKCHQWQKVGKFRSQRKNYQSRIFRGQGNWLITKGGLIWESFSLWLKSPKKEPNLYPEHLLLMWIMLKIMIWYLCFWDLSPSEKLSKIKPPLLYAKFELSQILFANFPVSVQMPTIHYKYLFNYLIL